MTINLEVFEQFDVGIREEFPRTTKRYPRLAEHFKYLTIKSFEAENDSDAYSPDDEIFVVLRELEAFMTVMERSLAVLNINKFMEMTAPEEESEPVLNFIDRLETTFKLQALEDESNGA